MSQLKISDFPPQGIGERPVILKKLVDASRELAYLEGMQTSLPNPDLISETLPLQEAQDSSEIENIVTTNDELYQSRVGVSKMPIAIREVSSYLSGMELGTIKLKQEQNIISINNILAIQQEIVGNDAGFRNQAGTVIKNNTTGEILHTPPQTIAEIEGLMKNLLEYINMDNGEHPLVKMALIHHQFESIHPFFDGNGRTGRILNLLYLIKQGEIRRPVLYLSRFINHNRNEYYHLLQAVRSGSRWEEWVIYMLTGIAHTAAQTTDLISKIKQQFAIHKEDIKNNYKFYSHELLNHLYAYPYTRIAHMAKHLEIDPRTATKYLNQLSFGKVLTRAELDNRVYYINHKLYDILTNTPSLKISNLS